MERPDLVIGFDVAGPYINDVAQPRHLARHVPGFRTLGAMVT